LHIEEEREVEPLRTLLSVPGNRQKMIDKARHLPADVLILDLEDSVPQAEKAAARTMVRESIAGMALAGQQVFVRINSIASSLALEDLEAVIVPGIDGVNQPKPATAGDVIEVADIIERLEKERGIAGGSIKLLPWVETAKGLLNAFDIASVSPRVVGIVFGAEDFALDTGIMRTEEGDELLYPRTTVVIAARAAGVGAVDTPYNNFTDQAGLEREATLARNLGFDGKFLIHPDQIEPVNRIFRPTEEEMAHARQVVAAFEEAEVQGLGATSLDGKMIDTPIANQARRQMAIADAIARREG
jgi:citrate lyase subunit beta/citryl-CoA lyase